MAAKKVSNKIVSDKIVVLVTCGSAKEARSIVRSLVERKLAVHGRQTMLLESIVRIQQQETAARSQSERV